MSSRLLSVRIAQIISNGYFKQLFALHPATINLKPKCNAINSHRNGSTLYTTQHSPRLLAKPGHAVPCHISLPTRRGLWGWLNAVFNQYDSSRVQEVGANRACAEWLLRCGASLRWEKHGAFIKDYNSLPVGGPRQAIGEVDGTDSAVMNIGFEYFRGCKNIERVVLHRASYVDDEALRQLQFLRGSLKHLQVSACGNVTIDGLKHLAKLSNLEYLLLYDFPAVKDKDAAVQYLEEKLPNCTVLFTYASDAEQQQLQRQQEREKELTNDSTDKDKK